MKLNLPQMCASSTPYAHQSLWHGFQSFLENFNFGSKFFKNGKGYPLCFFPFFPPNRGWSQTCRKDGIRPKYRNPAISGVSNQYSFLTLFFQYFYENLHNSIFCRNFENLVEFLPRMSANVAPCAH